MSRALLLALLFAGPARAGGRPPAAAELSRRGAAFGRQGSYREAEEAFRKAADLDRSPAAARDLMWAAWRAEDLPGTISAAGRALAARPSDLEALNLLALAQFRAGRLADAKRAYRASEDLSPRQENVQRALAALDERFRDFEGALVHCERALALKPDEPEMLAQHARLLLHLGRYAEAAAAWSRVLEVRPADGARLSLARALYFSGERASAVERLRLLLAASPRDTGALDFLSQIAAVNGRPDWAIPALERALDPCPPSDEARLMELSALHESAGAARAALRVLDRGLAQNPRGGALIRAKAELLETLGREAEALPLFRRLTKLNPDSALAWHRLAESYDASGEPRAALRAMTRARELDPGDPALTLKTARLLHENGFAGEAVRMLRGWLAANPEEGVPVLLYHGLALRDDDPMLASPVHLPLAAFRAQMKALHEAGYVPITATEMAAWFAGRAVLPGRRVLITFDDARLDGFRNADPVLDEFGLKATMFTPLSNVDPGLPGFASWEELRKYQGTGRWEIQAHGDQSHTYIRRDADGRVGRFLTNRMWLPAAGRLETVAEWSARVSGDHESVKRRLAEHLGEKAVAFAYPEGEFGQMEAPNLERSAERNLALCGRSFALCFQQDSSGVNVRSMDPARLVRVEPRRDWSGARLLAHLRDRTPQVLIRRQLLMMLAWSGRTHAAAALLEENRRAGVSPSALMADQARIFASAGDRAAGLRLAKQALELDAEGGDAALVAELSRPADRRWTPEILAFSDNKGRDQLLFRQRLGELRTPFGRAALIHFRGVYTEPGAPRVTDDGAGVELSGALAPDHEASVELDGHAVSSGGSAFTAVASARSRWTDSIATEERAGEQPYENARSLADGVRERFVLLSAVSGRPEERQFSARLRLSSLTDGNARAAGAATASQPLSAVPGLRAVEQFSLDSTRRFSPDYYSPRPLRSYQAGLSWSGLLLPWLEAKASYLPGWAQEGGSSSAFAHELEAYASARWGRWTATPSFSWSRTPSYRATSFGGTLDYRF